MISATRTIGWTSAGYLARYGRRGGFKAGPKDFACALEAQRIQSEHRNWVVMWSVWRRTFTAFGCFAPQRLVLDAPTSAQLLDQMREAELHNAPHVL